MRMQVKVTFSNSGKFVDYSSAYLAVPMIMTLYPTSGPLTDLDDQDLSMAVGIKNGHHQLIHSFSCEINNSSVCQLVPYTNIYVSYKLLTSLSANELYTVAPSIGFYPDTPDSFNYSANASPDGDGVSNNRIWGYEKLYPNTFGSIVSTEDIAQSASPTATNKITNGDDIDYAYLPHSPTNISIQTTANFGLYQRTKMFALNPAKSPYSDFLDESSCSTLLKNYYYVMSSGSAGTNPHVWIYMARIRLKDLHDLFAQLTLVRGLYCRFIFNMNVCTATVTLTNEAGTDSTPTRANAKLSAITASQGTCPFILTSFQKGQPNSKMLKITDGNVETGTIQVRNAIGSVTFTGASSQTFTINHPMRTCRLYAPLITLNQDSEDAYLKLNSQRRIRYKDIYQYTISSIASDGVVNNLLTNGVANSKALVLVPILSNSENGTASISPLLSVFATEPGTTSPLAAFTNIQVQLAGVSIWQSQELYDWENFQNELQSINSVNGNQTTGFGSGLISEYSYGLTQHYIVCDLSRRISAEDRVPKSIVVLAQNLCNRVLDIYAFVEVEREIVIDLRSGARLE